MALRTMMISGAEASSFGIFSDSKVLQLNQGSGLHTSQHFPLFQSASYPSWLHPTQPLPGVVGWMQRWLITLLMPAVTCTFGVLHYPLYCYQEEGLWSLCILTPTEQSRELDLLERHMNRLNAFHH